MDYPTLPVDVININNQLREHFGIDTVTSEPIWRCAWANDQYEMRLVDTTPEGLQLLYPELKLRPKYPWVKDRWILERLVQVPDFQAFELGGKKVSYECMWRFEDRNNFPVIPIFEACKFIVDLVYASQGKSSLAKYKDPEAGDPLEAKKARVDKLVEELFGDESDLLGRTVTGEAVGFTKEIKES